MAKYTTGEVAKLCGVTVRTVQYYDTRKILVPGELTEGGRRLYSEEELGRMKIICFLRDLDMPINAIAELLKEEHPENVIHMLLEQQSSVLQEEIAQRQKKLDKLTQMQREMKGITHFSLESIGDISYMMENRSSLRRVHVTMLAAGIPMTLCQLFAVALWIIKGVWWPFAVWLVLDAVFAVLIGGYYYRNTAYICPCCHAVFKPAFRDSFWARHTPNTRKLTCTRCGYHGHCVETYGGEVKNSRAE